MSGTPPYVELHAHSAYSLLDGASTPDELIGRAGKLGTPRSRSPITTRSRVRWSSRWRPATPRPARLPVRAIFGAEVTVETSAGAQNGEHRQ